MLTWHELVLRFPRDEQPAPERIHALLRASAGYAPETGLETTFEDETETLFTLSISFVRERLALPKVQRMTLRARKHGADSHVAFWYRREFGSDEAILFINPASTVLTPGSLPQYVEVLALAAGSPIVSLRTSELSSLSSFGAWFAPYEMPTDNELLDDESTPRAARAIPAQLALRLTSRVHFTSYDRARVPEAVGWINAWDGDVVDRIGREKVLAQAWEHIDPMGDGGLLLVACKEPPDTTRLDLLERIAIISQGLDLEALRRAHAG